MKLKRIVVLGFAFLMSVSLLVGCSSGPSKEAISLYNEQIEIYNQKIDYLQVCLKDDEPTTIITMSYPTNFFHLTVEEQDVWENAEFGKDKMKQLETGKELEKDADRLHNAAPISTLTVTEADIDNLDKVFEELKEKYKDYDFEKAKLALYE